MSESAAVEPTSFRDFGLPEPLLRALEDLGYAAPSPIQAEGIPALLGGRDLIGQAQTGTGKTAAFALPLLARLDLAQREPQVLVLAPTRELAIQNAEAFQRYARNLPGFHVLPVYGGQSMVAQLRGLQRSVHVIVGTPGRIMDHLRRGSLSLAKLRGLVLDEADEMLRMGFLEEVTWILEHTPDTRQTALFSATLPEPIRQVAHQHLRDPVEIRIKARTSTVEAIRQRYWQVSGLHKLDALTRILEIEDIDAVLVFVRTKTATVELAERLEARGYAAAALSGDLNQTQREKTVEMLKGGQIDVVVATDVAARGLDVPRVSHVINYDIPYDIEAYIHRIGRTGRAGRAGEAILFVSPREIRMLRAIERATRQPLAPMRAPSREALAERRVQQFKQAVADALASEDLEFFAALVDELAAEQGVSLREVAAGLARLVQQDRPLQPEYGPADAPKPAETRRERRNDAPASQRTSTADAPARRRRDAVPESSEPDRAQPSARAAREAPPAASRSAENTSPARPARPRPGAPAPDMPRPVRPAPDPAARTAVDGDLEPEMVRYRLDIGHQQGATPKHIVGAIANEAGIDSRYIGRIDIFDDFSTVALPAGMPREILQHLKKVRLGRFRFNLTALTEPQTRGLAELSVESARQLRGSVKPRRKKP